MVTNMITATPPTAPPIVAARRLRDDICDDPSPVVLGVLEVVVESVSDLIDEVMIRRN
jgi:hypothetical protein